jgi:hypothetical protein
MLGTIVEKVKGLLLNPVETFRNSRDDEPGTVFTYLAALLLVDAVLMAIVTFVIGMIPVIPKINLGVPLPVIIFFGVLIGGFIATLVFAAWVHLWAYIFGGRKGIMATVRAIVYGHTPQLLLGWIPFISFIFTLWSIVLDILGLRELQELSTTKAILVIAIAVIIPLILLILAIAYFMVSYATMVPPTNLFSVAG